MATAALVCGIVGAVLFIFLVPSVVALVLGLIAASRARRHPHPGDGRGRAVAGWILGIVGIVAFVSVVIVAIVVEDEDSGGIVEGDDVSVYELEPGDCLNLPTEGEAPIEELPRRDCDEPHDAEVYAIDDLTTDAENYPGLDVVAADTERICRGDAFERYVGTDVESSRYGYYYLFPSDDSWEQGDREYVCMVISLDGSSLTGSAEGSGD